MKTRYGQELRSFILKNAKILKIIDFGDLPVFSDATTYPCIIVLEKSLKRNYKNTILVAKLNNLDFTNLEELNYFKIQQSSLSNNPWSLEPTINIKIREKIENAGVPLIDFIKSKLYRGITTGCNDAFIITGEVRKTLLKKYPTSTKIIKPFLTGKNIKRYSINFKKLYLIHTYTGIGIKKYPAVWNHLKKYKGRLDTVWEVRQGKHPWYELRGCSYYNIFTKPKIIYPRINIEPNFTLDDGTYFTQDSSFIIPSQSKYLLSILNSKVIRYYARSVCSLLRGGYYDYRYQYVESFPIVKSNEEQQKPFIKLADRMLALNKQLQEEKSDNKRDRIKEQIKQTDDEIDQMVYKLYGLTKEEIKIVEGSLRNN